MNEMIEEKKAETIARMEELFQVIKHNTKCFGGDKELYDYAFKARVAIKVGNKSLAREKGWKFVEKYCTPGSEYEDLTGVLQEFGAIVEHAHRW